MTHLRRAVRAEKRAEIVLNNLSGALAVMLFPPPSPSAEEAPAQIGRWSILSVVAGAIALQPVSGGISAGIGWGRSWLIRRLQRQVDSRVGCVGLAYVAFAATGMVQRAAADWAMAQPRLARLEQRGLATWVKGERWQRELAHALTVVTGLHPAMPRYYPQ